MYRTNKQPLGQPTRGKTATGRLRRLDRFLLLTAAGLLARRTGDWAEAPFVDLGYGARPTTTLEAARRFRAVNPCLQVIGIEIDARRVARAQADADRTTRFIRGGFDGPVHTPARLVRAMNVLRQYDESEVAEAHRRMRRLLRPGGLLVEGTCDPTGATMVVNLIGETGRTLLFSQNLRHQIDSPRALQPRLPKDWIHRIRPGEPVHGLMEDWERAWRAAHSHRTFGPIAHWVEAARRLQQRRKDVQRTPRLWRRGYLLWRP